MAPSALETMVPLSVPSDLSDRSDLSDKKLVDLLTCRLVDLLTLFYNSFFEVFCEVDADLVACVFDSHFCHVMVNHNFHEFLE